MGAETFRDPDVLASEANFSIWFPSIPGDRLAEAFGDAAIYGRCRTSIHRHARLAGAWPTVDPYTLLNQLKREYRLATVNRRVIEAVFPGLSLRDLTREMAIVGDRDLRGRERNKFRKSLSTIDKLREDPRVVAAGILGPEKFGPMPTYRDGDKRRIELPAALAAVRGRLPVSHATHARRAFELAVDLGILVEGGPEPGWSMTIEDATRYQVAVTAQVSADTADLYLRTLLSLLRTTDPATVPENVTADRVQRPERYAAAAEPRKSRSERRPVVLPDLVEAEVSGFAKDRSACPRRVKDLRRILRNLLEAGFDIDSPTFFADASAFFDTTFPERSDLTLRDYRTVLRAFLAHTNRLSAWDGVISRATAMDAKDVHLSGLLLIRKYAQSAEPPISPAEIDVAAARQFLLRARASQDVPKCLSGLASLDVLRTKFPVLLPGSTIGDQRPWLRRWSGELPTSLEESLRSVAMAAGYGEFAVKELITASRRLYSLTTDKTIFDAPIDLIPWRELTVDADARHEQEMVNYRLILLRLADHVDRKWMPGWRTLQARIVDAGIPRVENPVDTLMEVATDTGLEPWQLDREWAWVHERSLRPDLRQKWTRAIDNFDALYAVPEIAGDTLLPAAQLGPMPRIGARLKNAHLPLPRRFEAALEGETKQVLEAAHFLWRCLRAFGVYSRNDDPAPDALLREENLDRILREQPYIGAQSARLHIARIRVWRESWSGRIYIRPTASTPKVSAGLR
ncbi:hypothetical protein P6F28_17770 [Roseicyclus marinus]|nr:hypothetical protein [Roseicyclus marinus]MDG3043124.1 hypothetical protein [Roseicyclus marinus]